MTPHDQGPQGASEFEREARRGSQRRLPELLRYLRFSGKWWLLPILVALLAVGLMVVVSSSAVAPLIYTLF